MKTASYVSIKEIKDCMKQVNNALKQIEEAEKTQLTCSSNREYDRTKADIIDATITMMQNLEEAVRLASAMGSTNGTHGLYTCHKVVEYSLK